mmetsp:Transcript_54329/g.146505  ORF Transcript_54329/g.146505 Transcript_54329/m.146505 type:complete len:225 (-) Transcript_54329:349-1023(-)
MPAGPSSAPMPAWAATASPKGCSCCCSCCRRGSRRGGIHSILGGTTTISLRCATCSSGKMLRRGAILKMSASLLHLKSASLRVRWACVWMCCFRRLSGAPSGNLCMTYSRTTVRSSRSRMSPRVLPSTLLFVASFFETSADFSEPGFSARPALRESPRWQSRRRLPMARRTTCSTSPSARPRKKASWRRCSSWAAACGSLGRLTGAAPPVPTRNAEKASHMLCL